MDRQVHLDTPRRCRITAILAGLAVAALSAPAAACLGHYYSPEALVANAALIIVGRVEAIDESPKEEAATRPRGIPLGARRIDSDEPRLTEAKVRVLEVLQGEYASPDIRIKSGPIHSCAPWEVHMPFTKGETRIFFLPDHPAEGRARLRYGGSMRSLGDREMVESRIDRYRVHIARYLSRIRRELPEVYQGAERFLKRMSEGTAAHGDFCATNTAGGAIERRFPGISIDIYRTMRVLSLSDTGYRDVWRNNTCAREIEEQLSKDRDAVERDMRRQVRRDLTALGMDGRTIGEYLGAVEGSWSLGFPFAVPYLDRRKAGPAARTTHFIYQFHAYDRGAMYPGYGMDFDSLAALDPRRLESLIPAMLGSADRYLSLVAYRAVERIPGTALVPAVFERLDEDPSAWRMLKHPDKPSETDRRLQRMTALAPEVYTPWGYATFWDRLRVGECFEGRVIGAAEQALASKKIKGTDGEVKRIREAIRGYLKAAKQGR